MGFSRLKKDTLSHCGIGHHLVIQTQDMSNVLLTEFKIKLGLNGCHRLCWEWQYDSLGESGTGAVTDVFCLRTPLPLLQCNNPKTKEPKLTAAARIVPEWVEYDNEIKELLRRLQEQEDAATQGKTPSSSPHKKGSQYKKKITLYSWCAEAFPIL